MPTAFAMAIRPLLLGMGSALKEVCRISNWCAEVRVLFLRCVVSSCCLHCECINSAVLFTNLTEDDSDEGGGGGEEVLVLLGFDVAAVVEVEGWL